MRTTANGFSDWLNENLEPIVTSLVGLVVGLALMYWQLRAARSRKFLTYELLLSVHIISQRAPESGLTLNYDSMPLRDPVLSEIRVRNAGNQPINDTDLKSPIVVTPQGNCTLVAESVVDVSKTLDPQPTLARPAGGGTHVDPLLLNAGEWFTIRQLTEGTPSGVTVDARIVGQTKAPTQIYLTDRRAITPVALLTLATCGLVTIGACALALRDGKGSTISGSGLKAFCGRLA